jgi:hypothetical protein
VNDAPLNKAERPQSIVCACGSVVPVAERGYLPKQCKRCRLKAYRLNLAERLRLAGALAPALRDGSHKSKTRRVKIIDKDGSLVRESNLAEVQQGILRTARIELDVVNGTKAREIICVRCGLLVKVPHGTGHAPKYCIRCRVAVRKEQRRAWKSTEEFKARRNARKQTEEHKARAQANLKKSWSDLAERNKAKAEEFRRLKEENESLRVQVTDLRARLGIAP